MKKKKTKKAKSKTRAKSLKVASRRVLKITPVGQVAVPTHEIEGTQSFEGPGAADFLGDPQGDEAVRAADDLGDDDDDDAAEIQDRAGRL